MELDIQFGSSLIVPLSFNMQLIPVQTISQLDLDTVDNATILSSARVPCRHGLPKLFIADDSSTMKAFAVDNANSSIAQVSTTTTTSTPLRSYFSLPPTIIAR